MNDAGIKAVISSMKIRVRSDGRKEGRITVDGKRKSFYGDTNAEIKQKAKEYLQKVANGYHEPKKITLNEYIEYWLINYKWNKIEPSSYTRLYRVYECQIKESIGKKAIGAITTKDIQGLIDEHANPTTKNVKPLAISGLKRIIHLLRPCLQMAVVEGVICSNPCLDVILPVESCIETATRHQITLNDKDINEFKRVALEKRKSTNDYASRDAIVLLVILNLGLRVGEALALEWNDFDMNNKIVRINKTVQSNIKNFTGEGNTTYSRVKSGAKTYSGTRIIKMNESVCFYLGELQRYDKQHDIHSLYFCSTRVGTRNTARNLQRSLDRLINKTNIQEKVTLHTLRHTFGSTMIRRGVGIEVVSKLMGHANINITYLKYIHVIQEQQAMAMDMVKIC